MSRSDGRRKRFTTVAAVTAADVDDRDGQEEAAHHPHRFHRIVLLDAPTPADALFAVMMVLLQPQHGGENPTEVSWPAKIKDIQNIMSTTQQLQSSKEDGSNR